ncbi:hypothetical protein [Rugamonas apoptosis]|nr:hypothetical protein [Rugamonas apoptosis]
MRLMMTVLSTVLAQGLYCQAARADGLADLKSALTRLQDQAPLKATLETKTWRRLGEGKDAEETQGQASVGIEDGARGMHLAYGKDILARMDAESLAQARNPNARTPTLNAAREFSPTDLRPMISAASSLSRVLEKAAWKGEQADTCQGKPARLLTFDVAIDTLSDRDRKYVKEFDGHLYVWIADDGTPLASRMIQNESGRAFIVIRFEARQEEQHVYAQVGDRLVTVRKESYNRAAGAGERDESRVIKTLHLQS